MARRPACRARTRTRGPSPHPNPKPNPGPKPSPTPKRTAARCASARVGSMHEARENVAHALAELLHGVELCLRASAHVAGDFVAGDCFAALGAGHDVHA